MSGLVDSFDGTKRLEHFFSPQISMILGKNLKDPPPAGGTKRPPFWGKKDPKMGKEVPFSRLSTPYLTPPWGGRNLIFDQYSHMRIRDRLGKTGSKYPPYGGKIDPITPPKRGVQDAHQGGTLGWYARRPFSPPKSLCKLAFLTLSDTILGSKNPRN